MNIAIRLCTETRRAVKKWWRVSVCWNRFKSYAVFNFDNFTRVVQSPVTKRRYRLYCCPYVLNCDSFWHRRYKSGFRQPSQTEPFEKQRTLSAQLETNRQFKYVYREFYMDVLARNVSDDGQRRLIKISVGPVIFYGRTDRFFCGLLFVWCTWMFRSIRNAR